ncbi:MAG TPA: hypothetical protein VFQ39_13140, partial [Longimicrobium sp.]|nr:hypothetical protein [Longimicrobium sp.]
MSGLAMIGDRNVADSCCAPGCCGTDEAALSLAPIHQDSLMDEGETVRETVRERYGKAALRVTTGEGNGCCGASAASCGCD